VRLLFDRHPLPKALEFCETLRGLAYRSGEARFEMACQRARAIGKPTMKSVRALLRQVVKERESEQGLTVMATNVDGSNPIKGDDHGQYQH
jgi:hypothetical protein